jgi:hypothetical protein
VAGTDRDLAVLAPNQTMSVKAAPKSRTTPWSAGPLVGGEPLKCLAPNALKRRPKVSGTECAKASGTERWLAPIGGERWLAPIAVAVLEPNQTMSVKAAPKSRTTPWSAGLLVGGEAKGGWHRSPWRFLIRTKRCP